MRLWNEPSDVMKDDILHSEFLLLFLSPHIIFTKLFSSLTISCNDGVSGFPVGFHERWVGGPLLPCDCVFEWADRSACKQLCESCKRWRHGPFISFRSLGLVTLGETLELRAAALAFETKESQVVSLILQGRCAPHTVN